MNVKIKIRWFVQILVLMKIYVLMFQTIIVNPLIQIIAEILQIICA
jgi:hypothetical protein